MTATLVRSFGEMAPNAIGLDLQVTSPICEGMNRLLASFQALYLQYQKHHFVVEGSEFYMLHQYFQDSYEAVAGHTHDLGLVTCKSKPMALGAISPKERTNVAVMEIPRSDG